MTGATLADLTTDWFTARLGGAGRTVRHADVSPLDIGAMCLMARAGLTWEDGATSSCIVKLPIPDAGTRALARAMGMYELEVRFYRDLLPVLGGVSAPQCLASHLDEATGDFVLVLDDLSDRTRAGDVLTPCTEQDCDDVLAELARLQAASWDDPRTLRMPWLADPLRTQRVFDSMPAGLDVFLARFGDALAPEHVALFERVLPQAPTWIRSWGGPTVVQHGDLRTDNVLFGTTPSAPRATLIDFQTVRLGPMGVDPAYFLGSSLSTEARRSLERDLIDEHHRRLLSSGVSGLDRDRCFDAYREGSLYAVYLFCGLSAQVAPSPRVDAVIADQSRRYADMALDLEAAELAGLR